MYKILITGGAGNIGSSLAARLSSDGHDIVIVDNLLTGALSKIPLASNVKFLKCDVNDYSDISAVFYSNLFDFVFHYAAVVGVKRTLNHPLWVFKDISGIENILKLCKNTGVKRVFYSSSSEVYGEPFEIPQNELTTPLNSKLPYAIVKNLGEAYCRSYSHEYNLDYTIFRFFNTYGPNQSMDFVVPIFVKEALAGNPLRIYGAGDQTRTFCYIDDNLDATVNAMIGNLYVNDVVNIGSDIEISILELARTIIDITGSKSQIVHEKPLKEGDMTRRCPDLTKMKSLIEKKQTSLHDGIIKLMEHCSHRGSNESRRKSG